MPTKIKSKSKEKVLKKLVQDVPEIEAELAVDVVDKPKTVVIHAAIAGVKPKDLQVMLSNNTVTIRGRRQVWADYDTTDYVVRECYAGLFSRTIVLPFRAAASAISAVLDKGLLTITINRPA